MIARPSRRRLRERLRTDGRAARTVRPRRGVTLVELLVSVAILGILGTAAVRLFVSQSQFVDQQVKQRSARTVSRVSLNLMLQELRDVEASGGVLAADRHSLSVRVPYALGMTCGTDGGRTVVSLLPVDSALFASAAFAGYAYRLGSAGYTYVDAAAVVPVVASGLCTANGITTLARGALLQLAPPIPPPFHVGTPLFAFQRIDYAFLPSVLVPGRLALWRAVQGGPREEVAVPFDSSSAFRFFSAGDDSSRAAPPADLSTVRGVELEFIGASERARPGRTTPELSRQRSAVFFLNRPEP